MIFSRDLRAQQPRSILVSTTFLNFSAASDLTIGGYSIRSDGGGMGGAGGVARRSAGGLGGPGDGAGVPMGAQELRVGNSLRLPFPPLP
jgi:hypothetical protein